MAKYKLIVAVEIESDDEETAISNAKEVLKNSYVKDSKVSLTRDGDRSAKNLLLPRLDGRFGQHLQGKKVDIDEALNIGS